MILQTKTRSHLPADRPVIVHTESSMAWGGQEIRIWTEIRELRELGWSTELWAPSESDLYRRAEAERIPVFDVSFSGSFDPYSIVNVHDLLRQNRVDVLVTHSSIDSWVTGLATRFLSRRPKLVRARHLSTPIKNFLAYRWFPDRLYTTSEAIRAQLVAGGVSSEKVVSLPTGVDLARFRPNPSEKTAMRKKYGLPADGPIVGGVFVIRSWKGIYDFVKVALGIPDAHFVVAGEGPSRAAMEASARQLGVDRRMTFLGHVESVEEIFWAMDVCLFPSTANEGIPQAVLQAQACGVPIVASDLASIREAAPSACYCAPGNVEQFVSAVRKLLNDSKESSRQAREAGEWIRRFDQREVMRRIDAFYRELLA